MALVRNNKGGYYDDGSPTKPSDKLSTDPIAGAYGVANTATQQQAGDYDSIMKGYKDMLGGANSKQLSYTPTSYSAGSAPTNFSFQNLAQPITTPYAPTADRLSGIAGLKNLSETGGYSEFDRANIRARGVSPIRSAYATANRDVDRQRALQGGFSPNYAAVKAKMAREQGETMSNSLQNVNADLAEKIASGMRTSAPQYQSAAAELDALINSSNVNNNALINNANLFNTQGANDTNKSNIAATNAYNKTNAEGVNYTNKYNLENTRGIAKDALAGMSNIYGTTPGLAKTFGDQALSAAELAELKRKSNLTAGGNIYG